MEHDSPWDIIIGTGNIPVDKLLMININHHY